MRVENFAICGSPKVRRADFEGRTLVARQIAASDARMRKPTPRKRGARSRDADRRRFERAAELYLHACYGMRTAARAEEFASFLRTARPYLSRIVPELIGMSLRDFLRREQLVYARHLLRTTPLTIDQIALASAFGTPWTFYRWFKSTFGMTPSEYRLDVEGRRVPKLPLEYAGWE